MSADSKDRLDLENKFRQTLAQIVGGLALLAGLYFTSQTLQTAQEGQITERFTEAVSQLGAVDGKDPNRIVRVGGIYALERIALDSRRDQFTIREILAAYLRDVSPIARTRMRPTASHDAQAAFLVLGRIALTAEETPTVNLTRVNLRGARLEFAELRGLKFMNLDGADLSEANLDHADLRGANLRNAELAAANLTRADLRGADLSGALLHEARLIKAQLGEAILIGAVLSAADLRGADLRRANLSEASFVGARLGGADLRDANLREANLSTVDLRRANLRGADLHDANLTEAKLSGTDFEEAVGLTADAIAGAQTDSSTRLPVSLQGKRR